MSVTIVMSSRAPAITELALFMAPRFSLFICNKFTAVESGSRVQCVYVNERVSDFHALWACVSDLGKGGNKGVSFFDIGIGFLFAP